MVSACPPPGGSASSTIAPAARSAPAARATTAAVCASATAGSARVCTATRSPRSVTAAGSPSATGTTAASRPSGPATTRSATARSATERPSGPTCVRGSPSAPSCPSSSSTPVSGTRPALGFSAVSPQKCAGRRMLAPESVPSPHAEPAAATIAASPPLLPPGVRARSYGLLVRPYTGLAVSMPPPQGGQFVLPSRIAPPARMRATTVASPSGTTPARSGAPIAIGSPAAAMLSLTVNGTPCSGPVGSPRASAVSARPAAASARSASSATTALIAPFTASIRRRCASTTSRADAAREATSAARSVAVAVVSSARAIPTRRYRYGARSARVFPRLVGLGRCVRRLALQRAERRLERVVEGGERRQRVGVDRRGVLVGLDDVVDTHEVGGHVDVLDEPERLHREQRRPERRALVAGAGHEGSAFGAALLAMQALGLVEDIDVAADLVRIDDVVEPDEDAAAVYADALPTFAALYDALEPSFRALQRQATHAPPKADEAREDAS